MNRMNDDTISRQAALASYQKEVCNKVKCYECKATDEDGTCKLERWIKELPSAERHGRLEHDGYDFPHGNDWVHCSVCGKRGINVPADLTPYCPRCGSRMDKEENE